MAGGTRAKTSTAATEVANTPLYRCGLSVRAVNVCRAAGCETIGELASAFADAGGQQRVLGHHASGPKTGREIRRVVRMFGRRDTTFISAVHPRLEEYRVGDFDMDAVRRSLRALRIPETLPIELVWQHTRIQTWRTKQQWHTLGDFVRGVCAMTIPDLCRVQYIGRRCRSEIFTMFRALATRDCQALSAFIPIGPEGGLSMVQALHTTVANLLPKEKRLLVCRFGQRGTLRETAATEGVVPQRVAQIQGPFVDTIGHIVRWFAANARPLWQVWEGEGDLEEALRRVGVSEDAGFVADVLDYVFMTSHRGAGLEQQRERKYRSWLGEMALADGRTVDLPAFTAAKSAAHLARPLETWLALRFGHALCVKRGSVSYRGAKLTGKERALLNIPSPDRRWDEGYQRFKDYHAHHRGAVQHIRNAKISQWAAYQRRRRRRGQLSPDRIHKLNALGFSWKFRSRRHWDDNFLALRAFVIEHGHCNPDRKDEILRDFVFRMRYMRSTNRLSSKRAAKLETLGLDWGHPRGRVLRWQSHFEELLAYKGQHGHCRVPLRQDGFRSLAIWVGNQRQAMREGVLPPDRRALLTAAGFVWRPEGRRHNGSCRANGSPSPAS